MPRLLPIAVCAVLALLGAPAQARGQLQVRQTGIELMPGVRGGRLVLANGGDSQVAAQVRVYAWTQEGGEDTLEPSTALAVSPPVVDIASNAEQLVRLVRTNEAATTREQAYRVVVDELPDNASIEGSTVKVLMRYMIPVFVRVPDAAPAQLKCKLEPAALVCSNAGGRAAQLGASRLLAAQGRSLEITPGLLGYVLAGSTRRFELDAKKLGAVAAWTKLEVRLNGEPATIDLAAQP